MMIYVYEIDRDTYVEVCNGYTTGFFKHLKD